MTRQVAKPPYAPPPREPGFPPPARPPRPVPMWLPIRWIREACGWDDGWDCCLTMRRIQSTIAAGVLLAGPAAAAVDNLNTDLEEICKPLLELAPGSRLHRHRARPSGARCRTSSHYQQPSTAPSGRWSSSRRLLAAAACTDPCQRQRSRRLCAANPALKQLAPGPTGAALVKAR